MLAKNIIARFLKKVELIPFHECWEWTAAKIKNDGYGVIRINHKNVLAHRVSYELFRGLIPPGLWVLHRCDNRSCVNPRHLFTGTRSDNVVDMYSKGRGAKPQSKKTHCPKGHQYNAENTYRYDNQRHCKKCKRIRQAAVRGYSEKIGA